MQFKVNEVTINLLGGRVSLSLRGEAPGLPFINVSFPLPAPKTSGQGQLEQRVYEEARHLLEAALDALNSNPGDPDTDLEAQLAQGIARIEDEPGNADHDEQSWDEHQEPDSR